jgi:CPA1 family monovalent cation:H+ antiporter
MARFLGVAIPISIMRIKRHFPKYTIRILTWSGLRGGISVALALSLYKENKGLTIDPLIVDIIITMTYCVVLFSIVVQGLTVDRLFKLAAPNGKSASSEPEE